MQYVYTYITYISLYIYSVDRFFEWVKHDGFRLRCVNISCLPQTRHEHRHDGQRGAALLVQISCACKSQDHIFQKGRFSTVVCSSRVSNTSKVGILRVYIYILVYIYVSLYTYIYIFMIVIRIRLCCLAEIPAGAIRCVGSNIDGHALRGSSHFANDAEPLCDPLTMHLHKTF